MILGLFFMTCFIAIAIIAIGTSIIRGILGFILGLFGSPKRSQAHTRKSGQWSSSQSQSQQTNSANKKRDKIFDKSDGEYVDFEEIKE
ncbi:MAG: DUF4834 family protein [Bacteroidaceae bacterium]|nr:DUF4834 family protein [Bacteroidaceae bacterium]